MAMQPRERVLAASLGGLAVLLVLYWGFTRWSNMFTVRQNTLADLRTKVQDKEAEVRRGTKAVGRRTEYEKRSLPTDPEIAHALYQGWLFDLVDRVKLEEASVTPKTTQGSSRALKKLAYTISGRGSLEQIAKLLYQFYSAGHLQQISYLSIKPVEKSTQLTITMNVEALVLPAAGRKDALTAEPGNKLALASEEEYLKTITGRNLFAEYQPPKVETKPETKPAEPSFELAKLAYITSMIVGLDGRPQIWLYERNTNKTQRLYEGDEFQVGSIKGKVKEIDFEQHEVKLDVGGKDVTVAMTKSLGDALQERDKAR